MNGLIIILNTCANHNLSSERFDWLMRDQITIHATARELVRVGLGVRVAVALPGELSNKMVHSDPVSSNHAVFHIRSPIWDHKEP